MMSSSLPVQCFHNQVFKPLTSPLPHRNISHALSAVTGDIFCVFRVPWPAGCFGNKLSLKARSTAENIAQQSNKSYHFASLPRSHTLHCQTPRRFTDPVSKARSKERQEIFQPFVLFHQRDLMFPFTEPTLPCVCSVWVPACLQSWWPNVNSSPEGRQESVSVLGLP